MRTVHTAAAIRSLLAAALSVSAVGIAPIAGLFSAYAQGTAIAPAKTEADGDYLVSVNKHFMWKSQLEKMHPELAKKAVRVSKENKNDFLVIVDKKPVWASTLRRDASGKTRPAAHSAACRDYLVDIGKKVVWASSADCPMGKHEKSGAKPLCCVAPLEEPGKPLPRCCTDAEKTRKMQ